MYSNIRISRLELQMELGKTRMAEATNDGEDIISRQHNHPTQRRERQPEQVANDSSTEDNSQENIEPRCSTIRIPNTRPEPAAAKPEVFSQSEVCEPPQINVLTILLAPAIMLGWMWIRRLR